MVPDLLFSSKAYQSAHPVKFPNGTKIVAKKLIPPWKQVTAKSSLNQRM
uniref:Uncharacterized protein n=1 Tax=Rhizophora mucronata TaxID=61149 RepID=A0A2P2QQE0_RHIMU